MGGLYKSVVWVKDNTLLSNDPDGDLVFGANALKGEITVHAALYSDTQPYRETEIFVKVTARYFSGSAADENNLKESLTTGGMAPSVRFSTRGGWSVSRWVFDYPQRLCSCILSRRAAGLSGIGSLTLRMSNILAFAPGGMAEIILDFILPEENIQEKFFLQKISPAQPVRLTAFAPLAVQADGRQYEPEWETRPSFQVLKTAVSAAGDVGVKRLPGNVPVNTGDNTTFTESDTLEKLLNYKPGSVAYRATLTQENRPPQILDTRVYRRPTNLIYFKPLGDGMAEWCVSGAQTLYYNGAKKTGGIIDKAELKDGRGRLLLPFDDGYIAADLYTLKEQAGFYLLRTVRALWEECFRLIRLEWGFTGAGAAPFKIALKNKDRMERSVEKETPAFFEYALSDGDEDCYTWISVSCGTKSEQSHIIWVAERGGYYVI